MGAIEDGLEKPSVAPNQIGGASCYTKNNSRTTTATAQVNSQSSLRNGEDISKTGIKSLRQGKTSVRNGNRAISGIFYTLNLFVGQLDPRFRIKVHLSKHIGVSVML